MKNKYKRRKKYGRKKQINVADGMNDFYKETKHFFFTYISKLKNGSELKKKSLFLELKKIKIKSKK